MNHTFKFLLTTCLLLTLSIATHADDHGELKLTPLFDGKTLDAFNILGGKAKYRVENGTIIGTSVPNTPNTFLATKKIYGDFILEYEFKVDPRLNSGVQIRSNSLKDYRNGRVHGYQVEIDPSDRAWSAGIYDEARRGWLNNLKDNPKAQKAFKQNDWNKVMVRAVGDHIQTWINGVPAADLRDPMTQTGFIAFQVHGVGKKTEPMEIAWRNIRIQDLGKSTWKPLFNGKDLTHWEALPGGKWEVKDGKIVGTSVASEKRHGQLVFDKKFKDFTAKVRFKSIKGNSGFYFRVERVNHPVAVKGFQAEIDPTKTDVGGLYETLGRAWVVKPDPKLIEKIYKKGDWNEMTVSAHGKRIVVHLNNHKTVELKNDPGRLDGFLALQLHGGQDMHVEFESVEILEPSK